MLREHPCWHKPGQQISHLPCRHNWVFLHTVVEPCRKAHERRNDSSLRRLRPPVDRGTSSEGCNRPVTWGTNGRCCWEALRPERIGESPRDVFCSLRAEEFSRTQDVSGFMRKVQGHRCCAYTRDGTSLGCRCTCALNYPVYHYIQALKRASSTHSYYHWAREPRPKAATIL